MKQYILTFLKRGLTFSVGGPVVLAIVYGILGATGAATALTPTEVCLGILTVSFMAFIAAGITVIYTIEQLPLFSAILIHGIALYLDYLLIYLLNGWIQSEWKPIFVFTSIFIASYGVIWVIIYLTTKKATHNLNQKMQAR